MEIGSGQGQETIRVMPGEDELTRSLWSPEEDPFTVPIVINSGMGVLSVIEVHIRLLDGETGNPDTVRFEGTVPGTQPRIIEVDGRKRAVIPKVQGVGNVRTRKDGTLTRGVI
jgi:hypothetical protein